VAFNRGRTNTKHVLRLRALLAESEAGARPRLLDFGCGDGDFLALASLFGFAAFGVDLSSTRAARSLQRGVTLVHSLEDFDALGGGPLDAASLFETLEHVDEPLRLLIALRQRMRPGAVLIAEVPDCTGVHLPSTLEEFHAVQPLEHINAFTPETLAQICRRAGFEPIPKPPAHVTTRVGDLARTEASRFLRLRSTAQYFRALVVACASSLESFVSPSLGALS
jgi:SAM-dependent methyltransferase